jgi:hypothetical protein
MSKNEIFFNLECFYGAGKAKKGEWPGEKNNINSFLPSILCIQPSGNFLVRPQRFFSPSLLWPTGRLSRCLHVRNLLRQGSSGDSFPLKNKSDWRKMTHLN